MFNIAIYNKKLALTYSTMSLLLVFVYGVISRWMPDGATYFDAEDVLTYASQIRTGNVSMFDKAGSGWQLLCLVIKMVLPSTSPDTLPGAILSKLLGIFSIVLMYAVLARVTGKIQLSLFVTFIYAASFAPWWYSLQPDKYIPQLAMQAVAIAVALTVKNIPSIWRLIALAIIYAVSILIHTASGLVCLSMLPLSWRMLKQKGLIFSLTRSVFVAAVMTAFLALYYYIFLTIFIKPSNINESLQWLLSYTGIPGEERSWGHWELKSIFLSVLGLGRTILTSEFLFGIPEFMSAATNTFPYKIFVEEKWLGQSFQLWQLKVGAVLLGLSIVLLLMLVGEVVKVLFRSCCEKQLRFGFEIAVVLCYLLPAIVFFSWWEPSNNEFWISPWYAICMVSGFVLANSSSDHLYLIAGLSGLVLCIVNGFFGVYPRLNPKNDYWLETEKAVSNQAKNGDLILEYTYMAVSYAHYLSNAKVVELPTYIICQNPKELSNAMNDYLEKNKIHGYIYLGPIATEVGYSKISLYPNLTHCDQQVSLFIGRLYPLTELIDVGGKKIPRLTAASFQNWISEHLTIEKISAR